MREKTMFTYTILLEKKTQFKTIENEKLPLVRNVWASMGHFDAIYEYALPRGALFPSIRENNRRLAAWNTAEHYYRPLYLLSETDDSAFWEHKSPFLGVVRVHFASNTNVLNQYSALEEWLQTQAVPADMSFRLYRTIELSDAILAVRSDRLNPVLDLSLALRRSGVVGKTYTYCGIHMEALRDDIRHFDRNDKIRFCSMRFDVADFTCAESELREITLIMGQPVIKPTLITGVDDVVIQWKNLSVGRLASLYRRWFILKGNQFNVFHAVITRLGTKDGDIPFDDYARPETSSREKLSEVCQSLIDIYHERIQPQNPIGATGNDEEQPIWLQPIHELTDTLLRMSKTELLDECVYMLIPGVRAFLEDMASGSPAIKKSSYNVEFVENWVNIIEHLMRGEGQLVHHPELRPILYDIPVSMLEYVLSFLDVVSNALISADENETGQTVPKNISFFLVPRLCLRVEAMEIIASRGNKRGLLMVNLPFTSLYEPETMMSAICHEVSHFVGEELRCREKRVSFYLSAAANIIASSMFRCGDASLIHVITRELMGRFDEGEYSSLTIKTLAESTQKWAKTLCSDIRSQRDILIKVAKETASRPDGASSFSVNHFNNLWAGLSRFDDRLQDFSVLFREVFADICMLHMLKIDTEKYIGSHIKEIQRSDTEQDPHYEQYAIRIYVSLASLGKADEALDGVKDAELQKQIVEIHEQLKESPPKKGRIFPITAIYYLLKYGETCVETIRKSMDQSQATEVREMYENAMSLDMDYTFFLEKIESSRKNILSDNQSSVRKRSARH